MPPKKYKKKKRKSVKKPNRRSLYKIPRNLVIGGLPLRKLVRLRFCKEIQLNAGPGSYAQAQFSANGCTIPDVSSPAGRFPSNFTWWMEKYDNYVIRKATCNIKYLVDTDASQSPGVAGILLSHEANSLLSIPDYQTLCEQKSNVRSKQISVGSSVISAKAATATSVYDPVKFNGMGTISSLRGRSNHYGNIGANPATERYFTTYVYSVAGNDPATYTFMITMDYWVELNNQLLSL